MQARTPESNRLITKLIVDVRGGRTEREHLRASKAFEYPLELLVAMRERVRAPASGNVLRPTVHLLVDGGWLNSTSHTSQKRLVRRSRLIHYFWACSIGTIQRTTSSRGAFTVRGMLQ